MPPNPGYFILDRTIFDLLVKTAVFGYFSQRTQPSDPVFDRIEKWDPKNKRFFAYSLLRSGVIDEPTYIQVLLTNSIRPIKNMVNRRNPEQMTPIASATEASINNQRKMHINERIHYLDLNLPYAVKLYLAQQLQENGIIDQNVYRHIQQTGSIASTLQALSNTEYEDAVTRILDMLPSYPMESSGITPYHLDQQPRHGGKQPSDQFAPKPATPSKPQQPLIPPGYPPLQPPPQPSPQPSTPVQPPSLRYELIPRYRESPSRRKPIDKLEITTTTPPKPRRPII